MTSLSTHVLNTATGQPAAGVRVEVWHEGELIAAATTDHDGRVSELASGLEPGAVEIVFHPPSPYFHRVALELMLDAGHHHVPLLFSPYGCATYRGS